MPLLIGVSLALGVAIFARLVGFDRERVFYPVVLIVVASYYALFAVMGGSTAELWAEIAIFGLFAAIAALGFRVNLWWAVAGLAAHGVSDFFHRIFVAGRGVPEWWPPFCLGYDLAAAACLAGLLIARRSPFARRQAEADGRSASGSQ